MKTRIDLFGGAGVLALHKLLPALYSLYERQDLSADSILYATGPEKLSQEAYHDMVRAQIADAMDPGRHLEDFLARVEWVNGDPEHPSLPAGEPCAVHIAYLAEPTEYDRGIIQSLASMPDAGTLRIMLEKPYGENVEDAAALHRLLAETFSEDRLYYVDHYLGMGTIDSILAMRRSNPLFESAWDSSHIESIQISVLETKGVGSRSDYYDKTGSLLNGIQGHVLPLLSALALEDPFAANIEEQRLSVLASLHQVHETKIRDIALLGQYAGYRTKDGISQSSTTETFAALRLTLDQGRLKGVPLLLRSGRKCRNRVAEIAVNFRSEESARTDTLVLRYQPSEEIWMELNAGRPGNSSMVETVRMKHCISSNDHMRINTIEAYEEFFYACMQENRRGFSSWAHIEASWEYVNTIRSAYRNAHLPVYPYEPGTYGPELSDGFARGISPWRNLD